MATQEPTTTGDTFGEPIYTYTRARAIADGVLVDVTETAREAGFRYPVAVTDHVWADCVAWCEADTKRKGWPQDEAGRLWDVVWMASRAGRGTYRIGVKRADGVMTFQLRCVPRDGRGHGAKLVTLKAICGPGDNGEPVITIMFPEDD